jgi:hypothetical protein
VSSPSVAEPVRSSQIESAVVTSGKRKNKVIEEIDMTDPQNLSLSMAVRKRDQK